MEYCFFNLGYYCMPRRCICEEAQCGLEGTDVHGHPMMISEVEEIADEMKWRATVEDEHAAALDAVMSDQEPHAEYSYEEWDY